MFDSTSTDDGFPVECEVCGASSIVNVSRPPGDSVCPVCGSFLWVTALAEIARPNSFVPDLQINQLAATNRDGVIQELARAIADALHWTTDQYTSFVQAVLKREELGSTGIGRGFALPHASVDWIDTCYSAIGFAPKAIPFQALDRQPVHTIVMIVSPTSRRGDHLRLLVRVSQSLRGTGGGSG